MRPTILQLVLRSFGLLFAAAIQVYSGYWGLLFRQRIEQLLFDPTTLGIAATEMVLGVISGMLIMVSLVPRSAQIALSGVPRVVSAIGILLPVIALAIKGMVATTGFALLPISLMQVWDWAIFSQTPPLWLGIVLVTFVYRFRE